MKSPDDTTASNLAAAGSMAARLKLARLKRAWTQERLAEAARLGVRTIQRLEGGEEASPETLRALAAALEVPVETLRPSVTRQQFRAPWSTAVKVVTSIALVLLIGGIVMTRAGSPWLHYLLLGVVLGSLVFAVHGYSVRDGRVWVHRLGWSNRLPLAELTELTINPHAMMGSIRLFGSGGLFGYLGWFRNDVLGRYRSYVTDSARAVVLRFGSRVILVSPDDPAAFQLAVEAELARRAEVAAAPASAGDAMG